MWISKSNTLVKRKDGSYRKVKKGEPLPEAGNYSRPHVWATWIDSENENVEDDLISGASLKPVTETELEEFKIKKKRAAKKKRKGNKK